MKTRLISILMICGIALSLLVSVVPVKADDTFPSPDSDGDGISDLMETTGWYTYNNGPFYTDPFNADSDGDGLTDGEEKLFNTSPIWPLIGVKYDPSFQTIEYFREIGTDPKYQHYLRGGDQLLMLNSIVIRRGTTFNLIGPNIGTLSITGDGLTPLTGIPDPVNGGWTVSVPADGTVGTYTATATQGTWSRSMKIHVIFQLPTDLPDDQVEAFLYDDDSANLKDEVTVWFKAPEIQYLDEECPIPGDEDAPCSDWEYHEAWAHTQAFWTEQYTNFNFLNHTMPAIHGATTIDQAADAIGDWSNREFRVNYTNILTSFSSAMARVDDGTGITMIGGGCETTAGVYNSMLRSAGIASRIYTVDYVKTAGHGNPTWLVGTPLEYDNSTMFWSEGQWKSLRNYTAEGNEYYPFDNGPTTGIFPFASVGASGNPNWYYNDKYGDYVASIGPGWDFQDGSNGGGMVNTVWNGGPPSAEWSVINRDLEWDSKNPLEIVQSPHIELFNCQLFKDDGWAPSEWQNPPVSKPTGRNALQTYFLPPGIPDPANPLENWPYNPEPTACSASTSPEECAAFQASWSTVCPAIEQGLNSNVQSFELEDNSRDDGAQNIDVEIGTILESEGFDKDGDGLFDKLLVKFEVNVSSAGEVKLGGVIRTGEKSFRSIPTNLMLENGKQTVQISFDGEPIGNRGIDGPYQIAALWVAHPDEPILTIIDPERMLDYKTFAYDTLAFAADDFTFTEAVFADDYSYEGIDENGNGLLNAININIGLKIALPGTFEVNGVLQDSQGNYVGDAVWTGSDNMAVLQFDVTNFQPPFTLGNLKLTLPNGKLLDYRTYQAFEITNLEGSVETSDVQIGTPGDAGTRDVDTIDSFQVVPTDTNGNGRFDKLVVNVNVTVTGSAGTYGIEGLLVDDYGTEIAWRVSEPQSLGSGSQTMTLEFDGKMIYDQLPLTGSRALNLVALMIFSGDAPTSTTLQVYLPVALRTSAYSRSQFEPSSNAVPLFEDDIENGSSKWATTGSLFNITNTESHSWSNSWFINTSSPANATLALAHPLDLTDYASSWIKFTIGYRMASSADYVDLEASTDGGAVWTTLESYSGTTTYWTTQKVDLSSLATHGSVLLRFNAHSQSGVLFYLDDVYISAWPAGVDEYPLTITQSIGGTITADPAGPYDLNAEVTLTATPNAGYSFSAWTGDCAGQEGSSCTLTMDTAKSVSATFTQIEYALTINQATGGTITASPTGPYYLNAEVTLTATPLAGYSFNAWTGDCTGQGNPCTLTMNAAKSVSAAFTEMEYTLTLTQATGGTITAAPASGPYNWGDEVTLTVTPDAGYRFTGWTGDCAGLGNPCTLTMDANKSVSATFTLDDYALTIYQPTGGTITADPAGPYNLNDVVTLIATPDTDWSFSAWTGACAGELSNICELTITGPESVSAVFESPKGTNLYIPMFINGAP